MKKHLLSLAILWIAAMTFTACQQTEMANPKPEEEEEEALAQDLVEAQDEEIVDQFFASIEDAAEYELINGNNSRTAQAYAVDTDETTNSIIIDYQDGWQNANGDILKGKLTIVWEGDRRSSERSKTLYPEDFYINGYKIEGTRQTIWNKEAQNFTVLLEDAIITAPDGSVMTRDASWTINLQRDETTNGRYRFGTATGTSRFDRTYQVTIKEDEALFYDNSCKLGRSRFPVSGIKTRTVTKDGVELRTKTIDFGDGNCDYKVMVTIGEYSMEIDLRPTNR
ncbi:hypothetical protein [Persicobacter psychrovividus]|uniref:Lipoprotein n=1 Tax=Persicobacter psychrovividus TaxID=387638 RepID=A0ABM7VFS6_9BACT|nr:hypothetical protein PEPS_20890 [Persicobacter psychrovividus]